MPVFKTERNRVIADEPEEGDLFVQVGWLGPHEDGRHLKQFRSPLMPVEDWQKAVDWAVSIADAMTHQLYVVPVNGLDAMDDPQFKRAVAKLSDQQRGELRGLVVNHMAMVMRDSEDPAVRADAYAVLEQMKVVQP